MVSLFAGQRDVQWTGWYTEEPVAKRRKFEFDREAAQRAAQEAEEAAIKQLEIEQVSSLGMRPHTRLHINPVIQNEARKAKLPDFWLPSLTPVAPNLISLKDVKLQTMCRASDPVHTMLLVFNLDALPLNLTIFNQHEAPNTCGFHR
jgi:hypothetical protein